MSRFTLMLCDIATGAYTAMLPDFVRLSPSFEMSDVGAITIDYPRNGVGFASLTADARTEVAVLFDGVEMDDGRYRVQSITGDEVKLDENQSFTGVSLVNRYKKAIVYSGTGSLTVASDQTFINATPGGILKALFDQNAARGVGTVCDEITYASFSPTLDSAGNPWTLSYGNITYQVGVNYLDIMRNMFDNGMIEFKMVGRDLRVYNAGGLGVDRTIITDPVILRRGVDYEEAPQTRTNEQIGAVALIQGDNEVLRQEVDSSVATAWGRDEVFISQGGVGDSATLGVVAQNELDRRSGVRAERTRKVAIGAGAFLPYTHYRCSDYIFDGAKLDVMPERLRIRQMVMECDENGVISASLVLNDKFLEADIATARKVNGILGGASAGGSTAIPTPSPTTDNTVPSAPASVTATSSVYTDTITDRTASQGHLAWPAVTTNVDTSTLADLDHYETQYRWDEVFANTAATTITPGRDYDAYTRRFDRRGKGYGWLGGDGGASTRATSGKDFWAFADTNVGVADQEGRITSQWSFIHNSWVLTDPADSSVFDAKWGYGNRFTDDDAFFKTTIGLWQADTNCSITRSTGAFYYGTASMQITATGAGDVTARIAAGAFAYPVAASTQYSVMCRSRSVTTARQFALGIRWYDASNNLISTSTSTNMTGTTSTWQRYTYTATSPSNAVRAAMIVIFRSAAAAQTFNVDVCQFSQGNATYYGWNDPGRAFAGGPCAVLHPEELGGAELTDLDDVFWVDAAHTVSGKILVAYTRYSTAGVFKNSVYIAQYDGTTHAFESLTQWSTADTFNWWSATAADGTYLYAYGYEVQAAGVRAVHITRVPIGNVLAGTKEWWNGTTWTTTRASSAAIYTGYSAQFGGVTLIGSTWFAVITEYGGGTMKYLTASAVQGTWTMQGAFYTQPEMGSGLVAYFPRIHRQLETNAGIPMSYAVNGSVNGVNSQGNIRYYAPKFLIGPASSVNPATPTGPWSESRIIESGTLVDHISNIPPGANFQGRVRAVDYNGNAGAFTLSNVIRTTLDTLAPNQPSVPIVASQFQGIRIEWDGLDFQGGAPPADFLFLEVHVSEVANFQPGPLTKVDTIRTRNGGVFPYQGLVYGRTYYVRFVAVDVRGNRSDPSDTASTAPEQLVNVLEIAEKLITGAKIADSTLAVRSLTVAALEPSIVPNGSMEEEETNGSGVGQGRPYGWTNSGWAWGSGVTYAEETTSPIGGVRSLKLTMPTATDGLIIRSVKFPVAEGKLIAFSAKFKTSRAIATTNVIQIQLATGVSQSDAGSFPGASSTWSTASISAGTGAVQTIEGSQIVPAGHKWATVFLVSYQAGDGSGYNVIWDDVFVNPIGGSAFIADLSVLNGKIANLAVDNAKIANMSVGKLTAGSLTADMTVSARIKTANTGARVELNSAGLQAYNSGGAQTVDIAAATGAATFTGTFQSDFPSSTAPHLMMQDAGDRTTVYFFGIDGLGTSGNYAFINSPGDPDDVPTLGMNSGEFEYFTGVDGRHRLWLHNEFGMFLETVLSSDATKSIGGRISLTSAGSVLEHRLNTGVQTGGYIYVDSAGYIIGRNTPTNNGARITGDVNALWLDSLSSGTLNARIKLSAGGLIAFENGKFDNFVDYGADQAIMTGNQAASAGTSWAFTYGTTKAGGGMLPIVTPFFNAAVGWAVTASTTSGFTVSSTNTVAGSIRFWCYRI